MNKIFYHLFAKHNHRMPFIILIYFSATFIITRALVYGWTYGLIPELSLVIRGIEIHHFNFGIFILAIIGYLLLINKNEKNRIKMAKLYGIALALVFDEFGMWLHLENNYWIRHSYDAAIIIAIFFLNVIYLNHIWRRIIENHIGISRKFLSNFSEEVEVKDGKVFIRDK